MTADQIVAVARGWLGAPFLHQGRTRAGIDCAGLVIVVCRELGVVPQDFDVTGYTRQPDGSMPDVCDEYLIRCPAQAGGVFTMRYYGEAQHMGFFTPYRHGGLAVIHAVASAGEVVEHRLDAVWRKRIVRTYKLPGAD